MSMVSTLRLCMQLVHFPPVPLLEGDAWSMVNSLYLLETAHLTLKFKQDSSVDAGTLVYVDAC